MRKYLYLFLVMTFTPLLFIAANYVHLHVENFWSTLGGVGLSLFSLLTFVGWFHFSLETGKKAYKIHMDRKDFLRINALPNKERTAIDSLRLIDLERKYSIHTKYDNAKTTSYIILFVESLRNAQQIGYASLLILTYFSATTAITLF